jgi:hypothetical protein
MGGKGSGGRTGAAKVLPGQFQTQVAPVSEGVRRRLIAGLGPRGREVVRAWLDGFGDWTGSSLATLRLLGESADRAAALTAAAPEDTRPLHREVRTYVSLARLLSAEVRR